jgi:23S rRNA G2445 N2-methylase RlmL
MSRERRLTLSSYECEADVLEGLEAFALNDVQTVRGVEELDPQTGALRFSFSGPLRDLLSMRSVIAIYLIERFALPRPKALLGHQHFERLIALIATVRDLWPNDAFTTFRISAAGEESTVMGRLKEAIADRTGLTSATDEGDLLLRLRRSPAGGWEALARLSPRPLATRSWRVCNLPGALNATVAHAMMRLTEPQPSDRVLNMCCGSGTLLIERLALGRARLIAGCDIDPAALECARANLTAAGYASRVFLESWDASEAPVGDGAFDVLCADLPYGQLVGSHRDNEALYPRILAEASRVAAPGARMALISHEIRLLEHTIDAFSSQWQVQQRIRVRTGGYMPGIYVLRRV